MLQSASSSLGAQSSWMPRCSVGLAQAAQEMQILLAVLKNTELESYEGTTEISLHHDLCHVLLGSQSQCWMLSLLAHPMADKSSQQHSTIAEGSPQAIF